MAVCANDDVPFLTTIVERRVGIAGYGAVLKIVAKVDVVIYEACFSNRRIPKFT